MQWLKVAGKWVAVRVGRQKGGSVRRPLLDSGVWQRVECGAWVVVVRGGECRGVECWVLNSKEEGKKRKSVGQAVEKREEKRKEAVGWRKRRRNKEEERRWAWARMKRKREKNQEGKEEERRWAWAQMKKRKNKRKKRKEG